MINKIDQQLNITRCQDITARDIFPIYDVTPFTMLDFPNHTACIIWLSGCNMRCQYCHNPQILKIKQRVQHEKVYAFLKKRAGLLDGVVFSGGEASIWPGLPSFINIVKNMGFAVKLDTNGSRPDVVKDLLNKNLVDYIALDYKAPRHAFKGITGINKYKQLTKTLEILCSQNDVEFEIRTTVHTSLMNESDLNEIIIDLKEHNFRGTYYIQNVRLDNNRPTLGNLTVQERILDTSLLQAPKDFDLEFRNF
jgi:pyruvate formate lyase activating enzyme